MEWCLQGLKEFGVTGFFEPAKMDEKILLFGHDAEYIGRVKKLSKQSIMLDDDTYTKPDSFEVALLAASAVVQAVEKFESSFCLVRPPGHHAPFGGFCLFNNVAIAAKHLCKKGRRVFVFDFDFHHGNGSEYVLNDEKNAFYCSTHQYPAYPMSGNVKDQHKNVLNIPLPAGTYDDLYLEVLDRLVKPAVRAFAPDVVLLSAGFDSYYADAGYIANPGLQLTSKSYNAIFELFEKYPQHYVLEGGYAKQSMENGAKIIAGNLYGKRVKLNEKPVVNASVDAEFWDRIKKIAEIRKTL